MKKLRDVLTKNPLRTVTYSVVAIVAFIPALALVFLFLASAEEGFNQDGVYYNGLRPTIILTESMEPEIVVNSIIMVEDVDFNEIKPGDIIRYNNPYLHYSVVHRVVAVGDGYLKTKGDNNDTVDSVQVTEEMFNGRVESIHNEYAPAVTLLIGRFDMDNWSKSIARAFAGMLGASVILAFILIFAYYVFEYITINWTWYYKSHWMSRSTDWMDVNCRREDFNNIIELYKKKIKKSNIFIRVYIWFVMWRYYDQVCTEESKAKKTKRWRDRLLKAIDS